MPRIRSTKIIKSCAACGKQIEVVPSKLAVGGGRFCSLPCKYHFNKTPAKDRFARYLSVPTSTGCILWLGGLDDKGYGMFESTRNGRWASVGAHRVSWELTNGPIPAGLCVLHNCPGGDNPRCVNPAHLWLGTKRQNNNDMRDKGRAAKGEGHANAKLTADQVRAIRARRLAGASTEEVGKEFGVNYRTVSAIMCGKIWRHVS